MTAHRPVDAPAVRRSSQPRRGLHREEAAVYIGVSTRKFDEMVDLGTMPAAKMIGSRKVWDIRALDSAFDALPDDAEKADDANPWNRVASL